MTSLQPQNKLLFILLLALKEPQVETKVDIKLHKEHINTMLLLRGKKLGEKKYIILTNVNFL